MRRDPRCARGRSGPVRIPDRFGASVQRWGCASAEPVISSGDESEGSGKNKGHLRKIQKQAKDIWKVFGKYIRNT